MKNLVKKATVVSVLALSCTAAFAAESLTAKVLAVDEGQVALETGAQVPGWVSEGATVQALGWQTKVVSVDGSKIVISLSKSKASKVKLDSEVVVREVSQQQKFGC